MLFEPAPGINPGWHLGWDDIDSGSIDLCAADKMKQNLMEAHKQHLLKHHKVYHADG